SVEPPCGAFRSEEAYSPYGDQRNRRLCGEKDLAGSNSLAGRSAHRAESAQTESRRTPVEDAGKHAVVDPTIGAAVTRQADCRPAKPPGNPIGQGAYLDACTCRQFPQSQWYSEPCAR